MEAMVNGKSGEIVMLTVVTVKGKEFAVATALLLRMVDWIATLKKGAKSKAVPWNLARLVCYHYNNNLFIHCIQECHPSLFRVDTLSSKHLLWCTSQDPQIKWSCSCQMLFHWDFGEKGSFIQVLARYLIPRTNNVHPPSLMQSSVHVFGTRIKTNSISNFQQFPLEGVKHVVEWSQYVYTRD